MAVWTFGLFGCAHCLNLKCCALDLYVYNLATADIEQIDIDVIVSFSFELDKSL